MLAPFPCAYEYARLIFLMEDYGHGPFISHLQDVGKRLVHRNPSDSSVKYAAAKNLIYSPILTDRSLAYRYIHELIQSRPQWASPHGLLGFIFYRRWQTTQSKEDAATAVAEYEQYILLAAVKDPFSKQARELVDEMRKG